MPTPPESTTPWLPVSDSTAISESPPPMLDPPELHVPAPPGYEILGVLGRGGMGVVYKARQSNLGRIVALKMILGSGGSEEVSRFLTEAEIIANLSHPNIVQVHELGEWQGLPFFALEYCAGGSLASRLDGRPWEPKPAAELIRALALAIHEAHLRGVVHRDLKPGNVLLTGDQESAGENTNLSQTVKITDFGIAKLLNSNSGATSTGAIIGTPSYMAPEQARGERGGIGPATDVYALGAILYELVTGRAPFLGASPMETVLLVVEQEPVPPSRFQQHFPADLESVCLQCLRKESSRRYASAQELADDLGRFLRDEPTVARPLGAVARAWRWCRRNPALAALMLTVVAVSMLGTVVSGRLAIRAKRDARAAVAARASAEARLEQAEWMLYAARSASAQREWEAGHADLALGYLDATRWDFRGWEHRYLFTTFNARQAVLRTPQPLAGVALAGDQILARSDTGKRYAWEAASGEVADPPAEWPVPPKRRREAAIRDGRVVLTADGIETRRMEFVDGGARLPVLGPFERELAAVVSETLIVVWDAVDGRPLWVLKGHTEPIRDMAFSPDGRFVGSVSDDGTFRTWDLRTGNEQFGYYGHEGPVVALAYFPDGRRVATASRDQTVRVWDIRAAQESVTCRDTHPDIRSIVLTEGGKRIIAAGPGSSTVHDTRDGVRTSVQKLAAPVVRVRGDVVAGRVGGEIHIGREGAVPLVIAIGEGELTTLAADAEGGKLAGGYHHGKVVIWDALTGAVVQTWDPHGERVAAMAFHPNGALVTAGDDDVVRIWDAATGGELRTLAGHTDDVRALAIAPDGRSIVSGSMDQTAKLWDFETGEERATYRGHRGEVRAVGFTSDGNRILTGGRDGNLRVWEPQTGAELLSVRVQTAGVTAIAVDPATESVYAAGKGGNVVRLEATLEPEWRMLAGHSHNVTSVGLSPDGTALASGGARGGVRVWDLATGQERFMLHDQPERVEAVGFSADGARVLMRCAVGTLSGWDARTGEKLPAVSDPPPVPALTAEAGGIEARAFGHEIRVRKEKGAFKEAAWARERLADWAKRDPEWWRSQADRCQRDRDWFAAEFHVERLLEDSPNDPILRAWRAWLNVMHAAWPEAGIEFLRAAKSFWMKR